MLRYNLKNFFGIIIVAVLFLTGCSSGPETGVSYKLATERKRLFKNIEYDLSFSIPEDKSAVIKGKVEISFESLRREDIVIDFRVKEENIQKVIIAGMPVDYKFSRGHIIIPKKEVRNGSNSMTIHFIAGDGSLNRKDDFMYTLFVPDRASTAFPCFDQPDMKAIYTLNLEIPGRWQAVSNGQVENISGNDSVKTISFRPSKPLSTYLFAFAAGKFDTLSHLENGRRITIFHREDDSLTVSRNIGVIFNSHFRSLEWLADYTGISYPFDKLDIVLIPDFQYSGMEHPGAIYYRDSPMFLNENPSVNQKLSRANLIAHEVSHQWFGDLVTMKWFNDVWMKEVFAGFMADKIVNPQYPEINHSLNFLLSHYPRAYSIDRTEGTNPIRQNLDNLLFAGTLYGDIIYHKAPVMMMQLELLMGSDSFREGLRKYLSEYSYENADWNDLISILDPLTPADLEKWSKNWVEKAGMPDIKAGIELSADGTIIDYRIIQSSNTTGKPLLGMKFNISESSGYNNPGYACALNSETLNITELRGKMFNNWILPNSNGLGYGTFYPDSISMQHLLNDTTYLADNLQRASWCVTLNEIFLNRRVSPLKYFTSIVNNLNAEKEPLIRQYLLNNLELVWWRFLTDNQRIESSELLESVFLNLISTSKISDDEKKPLFWTFGRTAISQNGLRYVFNTWCNKSGPKGIKFDETDYMNMAFELAVRGIPDADSIIIAQEERIKNRDRLAKYRFMMRAVSADTAIWNSFFKSLSDPANRRPEPWVTEALQYFYHPLRSSWSVKYLKSSLDLLPEIQKTGDIFFPKSWLDATLRGFNSGEAYDVVESWIKENPKVSVNLKNKVLQSADILKRSSGLEK
jgi:aminopeptidase N